MRIRLVKLRLVPVLIVLGAAVAAAANVHFVKGPDFVDAGVQLVVSGKLAGLGEGDVTIAVSAAGVASVECTNPGGNVAPGQDTAVASFGSVTLPAAKNGTVTFSVATAAPSIPSSACPNDQWSAAAVDVAFGSGMITVSQGGVVVLTTAF